MFSLQPDQLEKGIVATVGVDLEEAGAQAGRMAGKVLKGEKTSKFPLETAKLQPIATNPAAAKQFGIAVPAN
jgi:putative ABC transport system substrate-binding protein